MIHSLVRRKRVLRCHSMELEFLELMIRSTWKGINEIINSYGKIIYTNETNKKQIENVLANWPSIIWTYGIQMYGDLPDLRKYWNNIVISMKTLKMFGLRWYHKQSTSTKPSNHLPVQHVISRYSVKYQQRPIVLHHNELVKNHLNQLKIERLNWMNSLDLSSRLTTRDSSRCQH